MKLSRLVNNIPKRLFAGFLLALAVMLPVATSAANMVKIEGSMGVANVTAGDTTYAHSVNATYNQVVKLQVYYHNTELPDSGKNAENLHVKINIPTTAGKVQKQTATISADNSNTVTDATTVNLDRSDAYLRYIPGSAVWRHNTGTNDNVKEVNTTISDNVVTSGTGVVLENEKPCYNFSATVTVLARVMVPGVSINKQVRVKGTTAWATSTAAKASDTVQYMITYKNTGNSEENNVVIGDKLPAGVTYVPGSTKLANDSAPTGKSVADGVTTSGITIGSYAPGVNAFVLFDAKVPAADKLACGNNLFRNIASAQPAGMNYYYNTADVNVNKVCTPPPTTPVYSCDAFHVTLGDNQTVKVDTFNKTAKNGAVFNNVVIDWGDQSQALTTNNAVGQSHQYSGAGPFTITATAHFTANGKAVSDSGTCNQTVSFSTITPPTTPPVLPNTGAGNVIGIVLGAIAAGTIAGRLFLSRKLARR